MRRVWIQRGREAVPFDAEPCVLQQSLSFKDHAEARKLLVRLQIIKVEGIEKTYFDFKNTEHFLEL
jgi:hypothetical protein